MKNAFHFTSELLFSFSRYLSLCLDFLVIYGKGLNKKINVNFKFFYVTAWLQTIVIHILPNVSRCLALFLMFACNNFPFYVFVTMIYWTSTEVSLNLVAPLDSALFSVDYEQINVFWTSGFDSVSIVFYLLSVSRSLPEFDFSHSIEVFLILTLRESIYGSWLWFH